MPKKIKKTKDEPIEETKVPSDFCIHCGMAQATITSNNGNRFCCLACQTNFGE
jgi:hypothetical protein